MNVVELILAVAVIVAATVAAVLGHLSPELAGILGVSLGYVGKGTVNVVAAGGLTSSRTASPPFSGAPEG